MEIKLSKGEVIINQGDKDSKYMYIVLKGELHAYKTIDGVQIYCDKIERGSVFGEISMILDKERAATIKAGSNEVILRRLDKKDFLNEIKKDPMVAWKLLEKLAEQTDKFDALRGQFLELNKSK